MNRTRALGVLVSCWLISLVVLPRVARADDLVTWLEKTTATERFDRETVERRRASDFVARLLATAKDPAASEPARRRALVLLASCGDAPGLAREVKALDEKAAERIEARAALAARLNAATAGRSPDDVKLADLLASAEPDARAAREAVALARDPLLDARPRSVLVRLLPQTARAASVDPLAVATSIVQAREPAGGEARVRAITVVAENASRDDLARLLATAVDDPEPRVRARAFDAMPLLASEPEKPNELDDPVSTFANLALAQGASAGKRARALDALGRTRSSSANPLIESAYRQAIPITEDHVRVAALVALGRTGGRPPSDIAARLVEFLASASTESQDRAIDGLGELPAAVVEGVLRPKLKESSDDARMRAARAARALALKGLVPELIYVARLESSALPARTAAIRALEVTGDSNEAANAVGYVLLNARQSPEAASLRRNAALALGVPALRGTEARDALVAAIYDEQSIVRLAAIRSLGAQGDPKAIRPLLDLAMKTNEVPARDRAQAIRALDALDAHGDRDAMKVVEAFEQDPAADVLLAGADYLAGAPRKIAIPSLLKLMDNNDASVRERAHASLLSKTDVAIQPNVDPFGYDPSPRVPREERYDAWKKWREWWDVHQDR